MVWAPSVHDLAEDGEFAQVIAGVGDNEENFAEQVVRTAGREG